MDWKTIYIIEKASLDDLEKILEILDSVLLHNLPSSDNGFLSTNPGAHFYEALIKKTNFFYTAYDKNNLVGFLIAYPNNLLRPVDDIQKFLINNYKEEDFIYVLQIAVSPKYHMKGVGTALYKKLFEDTKNSKTMVVTSAVPYNKASEQFHLKLGFKKIGKIMRTDGGSNFLYER